MNMPTSSGRSTAASNSESGLPIAVVERETGLGKDTLRVWEKRYGFPTPSRNSSGERSYSVEQVQRLKLISRLLDTGLRPGKVVKLSEAELHTLAAERTSSVMDDLSKTDNAWDSGMHPIIDELLDAIGSHDPSALRHGLNHAQMRMGLAPFVIDLVAPLTTAVGEAWAQGRFEIFEEHLYTEVISAVLRQAISSLAPQVLPRGPKVLLTTIPHEPHSLGLLMVEALLGLEGCVCVSLGTQTPLTDIIEAARAHQTDVVALSFSSVNKTNVVQTSLAELRARLPASTALWVGGACTALYQWPLAGVSAVQHLSGLQPLVAQWRAFPARAGQ